MNTKILSFSIAAVLMSGVLFSSSAHADLIVDDGSKKIQDDHKRSDHTPDQYADHHADQLAADRAANRVASRLNQPAVQPVKKGVVTQSGARPSKIASSGWARSMPLSLAVRQVVPAEFEVQQNGVRLTKEVSWSNMAWDDALAHLAGSGDFLAHIDWDAKTVSLAPVLIASAPKHAPKAHHQSATAPEQHPDPVEHVASVESPPKQHDPKQHDPKQGDGVVATADKVAPIAPVAPVADSMTVWHLDPALTLKENVEKWGERAGWRVVWEGSDYVVVAGATFHGQLFDPEGPLAQLIAAYERSEQPLIARLTTMDKVIHVRNKYYERQQVVPVSAPELAPKLYELSDQTVEKR